MSLTLTLNSTLSNWNGLCLDLECTIQVCRGGRVRKRISCMSIHIFKYVWTFVNHLSSIFTGHKFLLRKYCLDCIKSSLGVENCCFKPPVQKSSLSNIVIFCFPPEHLAIKRQDTLAQSCYNVST